MPTSTYESGVYNNLSTSSRVIFPDALPSACRTDGTLCGSFLTSTGPCRRFGYRGCPRRPERRYQLADAGEVVA